MATNNSVNNGLSGATGTVNFVGSTSPTIVTPKIAQINDVNTNAILTLVPTASAVNFMQVNNNITGSPPAFFAAGSDSDIGLAFGTKGAGVYMFEAAASTNQVTYSVGPTELANSIFNFSAVTGTYTFTWPALSGTVALTSQTTGRLLSFQVLTSGTAATYTKPAGVNNILVECFGGGGGGGGITATGVTFAAAGGGGGGGYCRKYITSAASTYTYTIGDGGAGGTSSAVGGSTGTATTFSGGSLSAGPGTGGGPSAGITAAAVLAGDPGNGGTSTGGDINFKGSCGNFGIVGNGLANTALGGFGGSCGLGGGGDATLTNTSTVTTGNAGVANTGGGGAGASGLASAASATGGAGGSGLIIVWEFS